MILIESLEDNGIRELLLSRMTTPQEAYEAGESMDTDANFCNLLEWQLIADDVEKLAAECPESSRLALQEWPISIIREDTIETLLSGMVESTFQCYAAGFLSGFLRAGRFDLIKDSVHEIVAQSPLHSAKALCYWNSSALSRSIEEAIYSDSNACLYALEHHPIAPRSKFFNKRSLAKVISKHAGYTFLLMQLDLHPHYAVNLISFESEGDKVRNLPRKELAIAKKAYHMISEDHRSQFAEGFRGALKENQLQQWCQHIIDNYHKNSIGGDTYRIA